MSDKLRPYTFSFLFPSNLQTSYDRSMLNKEPIQDLSTQIMQVHQQIAQAHEEKRPGEVIPLIKKRLSPMQSPPYITSQYAK
ncbi:hypothetical protein KC726_05425 [Candidatus Woesebacteria bacterium]|nr:hypothetical protein [Candidatus Woesebacteria bacterium]